MSLWSLFPRLTVIVHKRSARQFERYDRTTYERPTRLAAGAMPPKIQTEVATPAQPTSSHATRRGMLGDAYDPPRSSDRPGISSAHAGHSRAGQGVSPAVSGSDVSILTFTHNFVVDSCLLHLEPCTAAPHWRFNPAYPTRFCLVQRGHAAGYEQKNVRTFWRFRFITADIHRGCR